MKKIILLTLACSVFFAENILAQFPGCPAVSTATNVTIPCGQTCTNLTANAFGGAQTTAYSVTTIPYSPPFAFNTGTQVLVATDDLWSGVINLPFHFCFFGNNYNQVIVGSNGVASFNVANAGAFNNWNIPGIVPSATPADLTNSIMGPWQDIDPTRSGKIFYEIGGTAPCRYIKFSWYNVPYYGADSSVSTGSCPGQNLRATQQVVLYETTNVIDMYIQQKQTCAAWNNGRATQGIQNAAGTVAYTVTGRNASVWTAANDAKRFTPAGASNYTISWFQGATQIGSTSTINVCPGGSTTYTAKATYTDCDGSQIVVSSDVNVGFSGTSASLDSVHQISCNGGSDGAVYASYNTGSAILSYGWSPGGAGQTHLDGIPAGTYIFSVTDAASCTRYDTVVLVNPPLLLVNVPDTTLTSCTGNPTTSLTATPSGGTPGYTYSWTGGATTQTLTGVGAGTYTVTVSDSKLCTASDAGTISVVASNPTFNQPAITNATCLNNDGSITVSLTGAVPTINYNWSNSLPNSDTQTGLAAGTYSVTATDGNGCSVTASYTVDQPTPITFGAPTITDATCAGNNGSITVVVNGATPTINYNWSNSLPNSDTQTGLAAGTYSVTATDANSCSVTASYTVGQPTPITFGTPTITDATCAGNNGSITVVVNGATPTINYNWSNSLPNSDTQTGLAAGTYSVTATDANSCSVTASYTLGQSASFTFGTPVITDANCGGSNGSIVVTTVGATQPVDFNWSNSLPNNDTVTGLSAGAYSVTATDANGCSATATYNVGQGSSFTFGTPVITNATCAGNDGSIVVTTNGATNPIDFIWSSGLPNNDTVTGLSVGSYGVTATDANGCSATATYNISQGSSISITNAVVNDISCSGFGGITLTATGGTGNLTYNWNGGLTGNPLTNLTAGTYTVTIADQAGCTVTATYIVGTSPCGDCPAVSTNNNVTIPCGQTCTTLTATAIAGHQTTAYSGAAIAYNPPFPYNTGTPILVAVDDRWSGIINLPFNFCFFGNTYGRLIVGSNGVVSFNVANANTTNSWTITNPIPSATPADLRNCIMSPWQDIDPTRSGKIFYEIGGTAPCRYIKFSWYNVPYYGADSSVSTGSCPGQNLRATQQVVLYETTNVIDMYIQQKQTCAAWNSGRAIQGIQNAAGTVAYVVPGRNANSPNWTATNDAYRYTPSGAPNYVINWFQGATQIGTGDSITVCPTLTSIYNVQAIYTNCDNTTITVADSVLVNVLGGLTATVDSFRNATCAGNDGAVYASYISTGGTVTSFGWSPGGANQTSLTGLSAGTYIFTVTNSSGCTASDTVTITAPPAVSVNVPDTTFYNCVASVISTSLTATVTGGTPTYTYAWDNQQTGATITGVGVGTYTVIVTDSNGCTATDAGTITQIIANPVFNQPAITNVTCNGLSNGSIVVSVSQATPPITYTWSGNLVGNDTLSGLLAGTYTVTATDANGCSVTASYDITEPTPIVIGQATITDATCTVGGTISVTATGGTGTLTYGWSNNDTGSFIDSLAAGPYDLTVTDANGCTATAAYTVNAAPNTVAFGTPTIVDVTCNGGNNGSITAVATGGAGTITYTWNTTPTQTGATISGLIAGQYSVTITDSVGCSASTTYTVNEPTPITIGTPTINPATCTVGGNVTVTATGGTGVLVYSWSNGDTGNTADSIAGGLTVTLTVTDANACSITASYTIPDQGGISFGNSIVANISCNGANNGSIHVVVVSALSPIVYTWSPLVSTDSIATGLPAGTYSITVTDIDFVCSATTSFTITEPTAVTLGNAIVVDATCSVGGSVNVPASGGTGTLTYSWSGPAGALSGNPITGLAAGTYTLTVTDANLCSVTASYTVAGATGAVTFGTPTLTQPTCNGGTNGSITVNTTGGTGTIVYQWNPGASVTATLSPIAAGTYNVSATDANGCSATTSYTLGEPTAISLGQPDITPVTCSALGSISNAATGGTGTLTLHWSNNDSGNTADSLAAGNVSVTVTDANGCSVTASYTIPTATGTIVLGTPIINNVSCNGANDGSISVSATGGTGTITFTWANPPQVGATITGLAPATYTVTATDQGGCSVTASYTITEPTPLVVTVNATALLCFSDTTGLATANVTGGTPIYIYHWNQNQTTATVSNLAVGIVLVTVTDANGCTASNSAIIGQSPSLSYNSQVNQPTCADLGFGTEILTPRGGTGAITIDITGLGSATVTMIGADTFKIYPQVPTGCYNFTLTDVLGCKATGNFCVSAGAANESFDVNTDSTSCYGSRYNNGAISVTPLTLANAPYTYSLNGGAFQTDSNFIGLTAGTYTVVTKNSYGCLDTLTAVVEQPAQVFVNATPDTIITAANVGNQVTVNAQNFVNPVYTWSPVTGLNCPDSMCLNPTITVDQSTVYYILVHEASDKTCAASDSVVIIVTGDLKMPNAFSPNGDGKNDSYGPVNGDHAAFTITDFRIYNRWGQLVHNSLENWDGKIDGTDQPADTYIYYISVKAPDAANPGTMKVENAQGAFTLLR